MEQTLRKLKDIWKNLKKSPGRTYTETTVKSKLLTIENLRQEFQLLEESQEDKKISVALKLEFNSTYKLIREYLVSHTKETATDITEQDTDNKMASFNLELAAKTIPLFAGGYEELESFIITTELVQKTLSDTAKQDFLQYLYHAKLTSGVRTAIGSYIKPDTLDSLKELLRQRYRNNKTIPQLQAKHSNTTKNRNNTTT